MSAHNRDLDAARAAGLKTAFFQTEGVRQGPDHRSCARRCVDVIAFDLLDLARHMEASLI
ncbi:MAG: hypothetical protein HPM95_16505 [Alphaproteobacteria bacterium]|nr:hypothetical protein [Alphaproteobacteria bacterium]